jgi:DNA-binding phage protein
MGYFDGLTDGAFKEDEEGNPQFATVQTILKALGLKLSIEPAEKDAA